MNDFLRKAELLKNTLVALSTQDDLETGDYKELRREFLSNSTTKNLIPDFLKQCRDEGDYWEFIKNRFQHYAERRLFIRESLSDLFVFLEESDLILSDNVINSSIKKHGEDYVRESWNKALQRRQDDPEGAITASRTLIETVCKHILDSKSIEYKDSADLPELYKLTAKNLNLSPESHSEQIFKQILSGFISVVNGIGSLRNKLSDAHGKRLKYVKPSPRHASLVVNLSGSMAMFLLETFDNINSSDPERNDSTR